MRTGRRVDMKGMVTCRKFTNAPESVLRDLSVHGLAPQLISPAMVIISEVTEHSLFGSLSSVFIYVAQSHQKRCTGVREHLGRLW